MRLLRTECFRDDVRLGKFAADNLGNAVQAETTKVCDGYVRFLTNSLKGASALLTARGGGCSGTTTCFMRFNTGSRASKAVADYC